MKTFREAAREDSPEIADLTRECEEVRVNLAKAIGDMPEAVILQIIAALAKQAIGINVMASIVGQLALISIVDISATFRKDGAP